MISVLSLSDVAASILLEKQKFEALDKAKEAVKTTFKIDFPYWSFSDWNVQVSTKESKRILKKYKKSSSPVSIQQLIIDLPAVVKTTVQ